MAAGAGRSGGRFVGRDNELAVVARVCAAARAGRRQLAVVRGEPGIGKTRFCEQVADRAEREGFTVVWGRCWPHGGAPALWPWTPVLTELLGTEVAELLTGEVGQGQIVPERFARFAAVAARLSRDLADSPTMVVLDDVHSADEGALLLARFLASALDRLPFVLVLSRRAEPAAAGAAADRLLDELERDAVVLPLRRFDLRETTAFLRQSDRDVDPGVALTLLRITGGRPLFLARAVALGPPRPGLTGVGAAIGDVLAGLSPPTRRAVALAAVLGASASVEEVAALLGEPIATVLDTLTDAGRAGLVDVAGSRCTFSHELVRQAALETLTPTQELDAHAHAATLLTVGPEQRARHALATAARSDRDAEVAVAACRDAARVMKRGFGYEVAADLLEQAAELVEHRPVTPQRAALFVEHADAVLACGRLIEARAAFARAADAAATARDPALLARAALGLGGVWVHEHRNSADRQLVLAQQRAALAALPEQEIALRCRLSVRLAAEAVYDGGPVEAVLEALAATRRSGCDDALPEALSLTHHALLAPEHIPARLPLAEELIQVASVAGDGVLTLMGLLWRTVDLYHLGDPAAEHSLAELRQRADALRCQSVNYIVAAIDVMRLIRAGRLAQAETAAASCFELGSQVGDADATGYYGAQLLTIRWLQGRDAELLEMATEMAASATTATSEFALHASVASVLARAGRLTDARAALDRVIGAGLGALPRSSTWLAGMAVIAETARMLDDRALAREVGQLLAPFASLPVMPSLAASCLGSTERVLGVTASTVGDLDAAVAHLERAVTATQRLGNRPAAAVTQAELAEVLLTRDATGDRARAVALLDVAHAEAVAMQLPVRAETWAARAAELRPGVGGRPALLRHRATSWLITVDGREITLPDLVGLRYLATLIAQPGSEIAAVDLCAADAVDGARQPLLDEAARAAYRQRLRDLDGELAEAEADADLGRAERLRSERQALIGQLAGALGLGGRVRAFASSQERARTAVRKAIKRALDAVSATDQALGAELRGCVTTGATCRYLPGGGHDWSVQRPRDAREREDCPGVPSPVS